MTRTYNKLYEKEHLQAAGTREGNYTFVLGEVNSGGKKLVDIRTKYTDKETGELMFGKGCKFPVEEAKNIAKAILKAAEDLEKQDIKVKTKEEKAAEKALEKAMKAIASLPADLREKALAGIKA